MATPLISCQKQGIDFQNDLEISPRSEETENSQEVETTVGQKLCEYIICATGFATGPFREPVSVNSPKTAGII
jgi:hypothetical protein